MTTTYALLREGLSWRLQDWFEGTADSGTKTSIVDTELLDKATKPSVGQYILFASGDYNGQIRRLHTYDEDNRSIIWERPLAGNPSTDTYEIHSFHPDDIKDAINYARFAVYPWIYRYYDDTTRTTRKNQHKYTIPSYIKGGPYEAFEGKWASISITDQLLDNPGFEDWTGSSPDDWDTPTNITTAEDTDLLMSGSSSSCKCTSTTSAGSMYQTVSGHADYAGQRMSFSIWVYCMTTSRIKAAIYDSSATEGDYHAGGGWEQLTVSYTMPASPTALKAGVTVASGTALVFYLDDAVLWSGQRVADEPGTPLYGWTAKDGIFEYRKSLVGDRPLRLKGIGYLSSVSADTDEMELDDPQTELLYAEAACFLYRRSLARTPSQTQGAHGLLLAYWESKVQEYRRKVALGIPAMKRIAPGLG